PELANQLIRRLRDVTTDETRPVVVVPARDRRWMSRLLRRALGESACVLSDAEAVDNPDLYIIDCIRRVEDTSSTPEVHDDSADLNQRAVTDRESTSGTSAAEWNM
ncbi:MAG: hypothetical protein KDA85_01970, partial [Planctomycetaceae bacterium]|nr:hypothetical protein [Planctomycetaceae bacterium]